MKKEILKIQGNTKIREVEIAYDDQKIEMEFLFLGSEVIYFDNGQFKVRSVDGSITLKSNQSYVRSIKNEAPVINRLLNPGELYTLQVQSEGGEILYIGLGSVDGEALRKWFASYNGRPYPQRAHKQFRSFSRYLTVRTSRGVEKTTVIYNPCERRRNMTRKSATQIKGLNIFRWREARFKTLAFILDQKKNNPYFGLNAEEYAEKFLESWA